MWRDGIWLCSDLVLRSSWKSSPRRRWSRSCCTCYSRPTSNARRPRRVTRKKLYPPVALGEQLGVGRKVTRFRIRTSLANPARWPVEREERPHRWRQFQQSAFAKPRDVNSQRHAARRDDGGRSENRRTPSWFWTAMKSTQCRISTRSQRHWVEVWQCLNAATHSAVAPT